LQERGLGWLVQINPLAPFLELVRAPLLDHSVPPPLAFCSALVVAVASFAIAAWSLRVREPKLIFYL